MAAPESTCGFESLGVYQGDISGSAANEDFSPGAWLSGLSSLWSLLGVSR
jgi:hypothetical protein